MNPTIADVLRRMTMYDATILRIETDAGDVDAVARLFAAYGIEDAERAAAEYVAARKAT